MAAHAISIHHFDDVGCHSAYKLLFQAVKNGEFGAILGLKGS